MSSVSFPVTLNTEEIEKYIQSNAFDMYKKREAEIQENANKLIEFIIQNKVDGIVKDLVLSEIAQCVNKEIAVVDIDNVVKKALKKELNNLVNQTIEKFKHEYVESEN